MDIGAKLYTEYLNGDEAALEQLVQTYGDGLVRFAYCFVKDSMTAEDIAEDTFATLIFKRKRFDGKVTFKTYLYKIARNKCIDYLRLHRRFVPLDDVANVLAVDNVDGTVELSESAATLYKALQRLPLQYRDVLMLTYIDGFAIDETARIMGKNVKQTYNLLARAKQALKTLLINDGIKYEDF